MTRAQAKNLDDARTATEHPDDAPTPIVIRYELTVRSDMTASVTMVLDGEDGEVTVNAEIDARDERGRLTRHVTLDSVRVANHPHRVGSRRLDAE